MPKSRRPPSSWKPPPAHELVRAARLVMAMEGALKRHRDVLFARAGCTTESLTELGVYWSSKLASSATLRLALDDVDRLSQVLFGTSANTWGWLHIANLFEHSVNRFSGEGLQRWRESILAERPDLSPADVSTEMMIRTQSFPRLMGTFGLKGILEWAPQRVEDDEVLALLLAWAGVNSKASKWQLFKCLCEKLGQETPPIETMRRLWRRHRNSVQESAVETSLHDDWDKAEKVARLAPGEALDFITDDAELRELVRLVDDDGSVGGTPSVLPGGHAEPPPEDTSTPPAQGKK